MAPLPFTVRDDPSYEGGGVVALVVPTAAGRAGSPVEVVIAQEDPSRPFLGPLGWQATEYRWRSGQVRDEGADLIIPLGERVTTQLEEYTPLRIMVPALGLEGHTVWQGISPGPRSTTPVMSPGGRAGSSFSDDPKVAGTRDQPARAKAEPERPAPQDAERARADQEARAKAEAERSSREAAERARADQEAKAEAERSSREAAERARADQEARAKAEAERSSREAAERARADREARVKADAERVQAERAIAPDARTELPQAFPAPIKAASGEKAPMRKALIALVLIMLTVLGLSAWLLKRRSPTPDTSTLPTATPSRTASQSPNAGSGNASEWILVPAGQFATGEAGNLETLPPFWIQRHEVTNAEYAKFVQKCPVGSTCGPSELPSYWQDASFMSARSLHPVVEVSWDDAQAYARFIGGRLPSSKEWEKAARYPNARSFPWGTDEDHSRANILGEEGHKSVASAARGIPTWAIDDPRYERDASSLGIFGLAGNVSEWTNSHSEKQASLILVAGGSWDSWQFSDAQTFARNAVSPNSRSSSLGFRCAKDQP